MKMKSLKIWQRCNISTATLKQSKHWNSDVRYGGKNYNFLKKVLLHLEEVGKVKWTIKINKFISVTLG